MTFLGYIDLSKRRVSPEDIVKCEERYMKSKTVASIMRHVASKLPSAGVEPPPEASSAEGGENEAKNSKRSKKDSKEDEHVEEAVAGGHHEEERLERLYELVAWPLGKKYGHPYDAFKLALTCVNLHAFPVTFTLIILNFRSPKANKKPSFRLSQCRCRLLPVSSSWAQSRDASHHNQSSSAPTLN
jgi:hypothetical protein